MPNPSFAEFLDQETPEVNIPREVSSQPGIPTIAFRNNNPGNIRVPGSKEYRQYADPGEGFRDIENNVRSRAKQGHTLESYISKYAPTDDGNNTEAYINNAANALGVDRKTPLSKIDATKLAAFQAKQESGTEVKPKGPPSFGDFLADEPPSTPNMPGYGPAPGVSRPQVPGLDRVPTRAEYNAAHPVNNTSLIKPLQDVLRPPVQYAEPVPTTDLGKAAKGAQEAVFSTAENLTTPTNVGIMSATGGLGLLSKAHSLVPRAVSAYFTQDMVRSLYEHKQDFKDAWDSGDPERIAKTFTEGAIQAGLATAAGLHAVRGGTVVREGEIPKDETKAPIAEPVTEAKAPSFSDFLSAEPEGPKISGEQYLRAKAGEQPPSKPPAQASAEVFAQAPTYTELFDKIGDQEKGPVQGPKIEGEEYLRSKAEKQPPLRPPAQEAAEAFQESGPTYAELFDQAEKLEKKRARTKPEVPETGDPHERENYARENLAQKLAQTPYKELNEEDRSAIDDLVRQNYGSAIEPSPVAEDQSPQANQPSVPAGTPTDSPVKSSNVTPPLAEPVPQAGTSPVAVTEGGAEPEAAIPQSTPPPVASLPEPPISTPVENSLQPIETTAENKQEAIAAEPDRKFSSTQVNLPEQAAPTVRAFGAKIPDDKLADGGRETEPHITLKYGLHGEDPGEVDNILAGKGPITVKLGRTSIFKTPDADVLKIDVESPDLHKLNGEVATLPNTDKHPEYQPHVTIAYLKPGEGKLYVGRPIPGLTGKTFTFDTVKFSGKNGQVHDIPLGDRTPTPEAGTVAQIPTRDIHVDAPRFQFKSNVGQGGAGEELRGVTKYDPEKSGILSVWKDPANGKTYVVNGHNRLALANRTGAKTVTVRYLDAANATEARTKGALINIAEGRGDAVDAAKVFRDSGLDAAALEREGISLKGEKARQGLALANLDPHLFSKVVSGDIPAERAAIIGEGVADSADQRALYDLLAEREKSGKRLTNDQLEETIRLANAAPKTTETQENLFGSQEMTRTLIPEKAEVSDFVRRQLAQEGKLFSAVSTGTAADKLSTTGNVIKAEENAKAATTTAQARALYDKLSTSAGPVNDALDAAATAIANGENVNAAKESAFRSIRTALLDQAKSLTRESEAPTERSQENGKSVPDQNVGGEHNLFGDSELERVAAEAATDRDKLQGERLTAQLNSPLTRGEQKLNPGEQPPQTNFFEETPEKQQRGMFDEEPPEITAAKARLKERFTSERGSVSPKKIDPSDDSVFEDLRNVGAYYVKRGVTQFAEWSKAMVEDFGEAIRPMLDNTWGELAAMRGHQEKEVPSAAAKAAPVPANEPDIKPSKLAQGVEEKAIANKLTAGFEGKPEYAVVKVAEQAAAAADLLKTDRKHAVDIAMGRSLPPDGLLPESVFVAVENYAIATKNVALLRDLATSSGLSMEATGMGQRIRMLAERDPESPVAAMQQVSKAREQGAIRKFGPKPKDNVVVEIRKEIRKAAPTLKNWAAFVDSLKCT